ncbi:hypothetical protein H8N03_16190 [Ramlibacter sp. USB13]|uniref:Uncharacterized protein n=1 Tax=Ramlibacter cellulosilyticus TaxID=2764187 RepID=A0A923MUM3_9BURK|nr:hypothetical protein [Ramlibacter cellulosilyticus]MBC5784489.1 hypothetical protein [Ramlibacter cellulosilyticus]
MLTIEHGAALRTRALASGVPRITPLHDTLDKRHSDLGFSVDTGGRPRFRVLVARDRALFAPDQAGARNASNFYDSQREGLLAFDGPPCFYLVPRSALHPMLPAPRLYYTLIAYADENGTGATYSQAPESLPREAPSVSVDTGLNGSLGLMFGTPVGLLLRVDAQDARGQAYEDIGEDVGGTVPESVGLAADDGDAPIPSDEETAAAYGEEELHDVFEDAYAAGHDYDDGYANPASLAGEPATPVRAYEEVGEDQADATAAAYGEGGDDYDDGFGAPSAYAAAEREPAPVRAYQEQAEDRDDAPAYRAEHEEAQAYDAPRDALPEMLPDEDADSAHVAQAGERDEDEVEIEAAAQAYGDDYADGYAAAVEPARVPFDIAACKAILARIMPFESGKEGFARVIDDGEFAGRFGTAHPAYQRYHLGLTFGGFPFVQEHGTLGQLLVLMRERDRATFDSTFPDADTLIAVTTAADGPRAWQSGDGFSQRLRPVGGQRLWQEPWLARFRRAGQHPPFQAAQNELAASLYVQPVVGVCRQIGLDSEQGLAMAIDRAVQMGADGALAWILECATPVETTAMKQAALARLGAADLQSFQAAQKLPPTGVWDVATHAALIAAMRASPNAASPVLGRDEIVAAMGRHAQGTPWAARLQRIREASAADRLFQL